MQVATLRYYPLPCGGACGNKGFERLKNFFAKVLLLLIITVIVLDRLREKVRPESFLWVM